MTEFAIFIASREIAALIDFGEPWQVSEGKGHSTRMTQGTLLLGAGFSVVIARVDFFDCIADWSHVFLIKLKQVHLVDAHSNLSKPSRCLRKGNSIQFHEDGS